jgi:hypothetical protein
MIGAAGAAFAWRSVPSKVGMRACVPDATAASADRLVAREHSANSSKPLCMQTGAKHRQVRPQTSKHTNTHTRAHILPGAQALPRLPQGVPALLAPVAPVVSAPGDVAGDGLASAPVTTAGAGKGLISPPAAAVGAGLASAPGRGAGLAASLALGAGLPIMPPPAMVMLPVSVALGAAAPPAEGAGDAGGTVTVAAGDASVGAAAAAGDASAGAAVVVAGASGAAVVPVQGGRRKVIGL